MVPIDPSEIAAAARARTGKLLAELRKHEADLAKSHAKLTADALAEGRAIVADAARAAERLLATLPPDDTSPRPELAE